MNFPFTFITMFTVLYRMSDIEFKQCPEEPIFSHPGMLKCGLCGRNISRYTCPKCGISYCGIECYKSRIHSDCSEKFYQQNVMDEISSRNITREQQEAMLHLLTQEIETLDDETECNIDLETRLEGLDLDRDAEKIWSRLTQDEKEEFNRTMGKYVPGYKAWWKEFDLVTDESNDTSVNKQIPYLHPNIQGIGEIFKGKPSPTLMYDVVNVVYAYVCIHRMYNGDFSGMEQHVAKDILALSVVLRGEGSFPELPDALAQPAMTLLEIKDLDWPVAIVYGFYTDVIEILSHQFLHTSLPYALYCLSHLYEVFDLSLKLRKHSEVKNMKKLFSMAQKKLYFFLCWTKDQHFLLKDLCKLIDLEFQAKQLQLKDFNTSKQRVNSRINKAKQQHLVQEFN